MTQCTGRKQKKNNGKEFGFLWGGSQLRELDQKLNLQQNKHLILEEDSTKINRLSRNRIKFNLQYLTSGFFVFL